MLKLIKIGGNIGVHGKHIILGYLAQRDMSVWQKKWLEVVRAQIILQGWSYPAQKREGHEWTFMVVVGRGD